jgi:hypothetical protein
MIVPQKPWEQVVAELEEYRNLYREASGTAAAAGERGWVFCDPDPGRAASW